MNRTHTLLVAAIAVATLTACGARPDDRTVELPTPRAWAAAAPVAAPGTTTAPTTTAPTAPTTTGNAAVVAKPATRGSAVPAMPVATGPLGRLVVLGDSLTSPIAHSDPTVAVKDWLVWADPHHRFELVHNAGSPGDLTGPVDGLQTPGMTARLDRDVLAHHPDWVTVLGGTNDVGYGVDPLRTIANLTEIYDRLSAAGIRFIALTIPPRDDVFPDAGSTEWVPHPHLAARQTVINDWMRANVEARWPGAVLVDWAPALATDAAGTAPNKALFADWVHMNGEGARVGGEFVAAAIAQLH